MREAPPAPRTNLMNSKQKDSHIEFLEDKIKKLEKECSRLRGEFSFDTTIISEPDSTEPKCELLNNNSHFRIYIVWTIGLYPNNVRLLDIRAITTSMAQAKMYSKILRRDKHLSDLWERVAIEPRVANHLYAEKLREWMVNTGRM